MALLKRGQQYYAVFRVDGRQKWVKCGPDKKRAQHQHDELIVQARRGEHVDPAPVITFAAFADTWLEDYGRLRLKASTLKEYESYIRIHLKPWFGERKLSEIEPRFVQQFVSAQSSSGKLAPKTVRNHVAVFTTIMATAVDWGLIESNPAPKVVLPRVPTEEMNYLRPEEMRRLIEATPPKWRALIALACLTGMRKGELLGLKWEAVDLQSKTVTVKRSMYAGVLQEPKSRRSIRALPLPDSVATMLREEYDRAEPSPDDFVFSESGSAPLGHNRPYRVMLRALSRAGLKRIRFHDLRHSFVAAHIAAGTSAKAIQELAGHASITTTMDRYGHLLPHAKREAAEAIDEAVFGSTDET